MTQRHRRQRHLFTLWGRKARNERERILDAAAYRDEAEQRMARSRILELAAEWDGPTWNGPTRLLPTIRPLLTRGQAARGSDPRP